MAKSLEKLESIKLRQSGQSIKEIAKHLGVSAGSVSVWCREVVLTSTQIHTLQNRMKDPSYGRRLVYLNSLRKKTEENISNLKNVGLKEVGRLSKRDFYIAGLALYWAEGFKKDRQIGFSNLNPFMILFFIDCLVVCLHIPITDIKLRVVINVKYSQNISEIEAYWSDLTRIPLNQFQNATIIKTPWKKQYQNNKEYKGLLRIRVAKSLPHLRRILGSIEGFYSKENRLPIFSN